MAVEPAIGQTTTSGGTRRGADSDDRREVAGVLCVVLGEDDDPARGQYRPYGVGQVDALGRVGRGHPDVGEQTSG